VLRRISGEVTGDLRKLHNEELNDLYCSPNIRMMESRRMRWAGRVEWEGIKWIDLAQERDVWWALLNAIIRLRLA
jgi:hypothetical protein